MPRPKLSLARSRGKESERERERKVRKVCIMETKWQFTTLHNQLAVHSSINNNGALLYVPSFLPRRGRGKSSWETREWSELVIPLAAFVQLF